MINDKASVAQNIMRNLAVLLLMTAAIGITACAQDVPIVPEQQQKKKPEAPKAEAPVTPVAPRLPADKNKYAVIISGISGEEGYAKNFSEWTARLRGSLTDNLGFA